MSSKTLSVFEAEILKLLDKSQSIEKSKLASLFNWSDEVFNGAINALLDKNLVRLEAVCDGLFEEVFIIKTKRALDPVKELLNFKGKSFEEKLAALKAGSFKPKELINFVDKSQGA